MLLFMLYVLHLSEMMRKSYNYYMKLETIVLGGGCFWCLEASYQLIKGVEGVVSGYAGGSTANPDYGTIHNKDSGHAEVVRVVFDPSVISLEDVLDIFWAIHDPTTPDRQGHDVGPEYRSIILCTDDEQEKAVNASRDRAQEVWDNPIVTEIKQLDRFYEAEQEHQNYFENHPEQAYCQVVINPKLTKLREKFTQKLKDNV